MGMADEVRQQRHAEHAAQQSAVATRAQLERHWRAQVDACALEFAQAAAELGVKPDRAGLFREPVWVVHVRTARAYPGDYVDGKWEYVAVDRTGSWTLVWAEWAGFHTTKRKLTIGPKAEIGDFDPKQFATNDEIREGFLQRLRRG